MFLLPIVGKVSAKFKSTESVKKAKSQNILELSLHFLLSVTGTTTGFYPKDIIVGFVQLTNQI